MKSGGSFLRAVSVFVALAALLTCSASYASVTISEDTYTLNVGYAFSSYDVPSDASSYVPSGIAADLSEDIAGMFTYSDSLGITASGDLSGDILVPSYPYTLLPLAQYILSYDLAVLGLESTDSSSYIYEAVTESTNSLVSTALSRLESNASSAVWRLDRTASSLADSSYIHVSADNITPNEAMEKLAGQAAYYGALTLDYTMSDDFAGQIPIAVGPVVSVDEAGYYMLQLPVVASSFYRGRVKFGVITEVDIPQYTTYTSSGQTWTYISGYVKGYPQAASLDIIADTANYAIVNTGYDSYSSIALAGDAAIPSGASDPADAESYALPGVTAAVVYLVPDVRYRPVLTMGASEVARHYAINYWSSYDAPLANSTATSSVDVDLTVYEYTDDYYTTIISSCDKAARSSDKLLNMPYNLFDTTLNSSGQPQPNTWTPDTSTLNNNYLAAALTLPQLSITASKGVLTTSADYLLKVTYQIPRKTSTLDLASEDQILVFYTDGENLTEGTAKFLSGDLSEITTAQLRALSQSSGSGNATLDGYIVMHLPTQSEDVSSYTPLVAVKTIKPITLTIEGEQDINFTAGEADSTTFTVWASNIAGTPRWQINDDELLMQEVDVVITEVSRDSTTWGKRVVVGSSHKSIPGRYTLDFYVDDDRKAGFTSERLLQVYITVGEVTGDLVLSAENTSPATSGSTFSVPLTLTGSSGLTTWSITGASGLAVSLTSRTTTDADATNSVSVTVPEGTADGTYSFTVNVTDNAGRSTSETVTVTVNNEGSIIPEPVPPVSEISISPSQEEREVEEGQEFELTFNAFNNYDVVDWRISNTSWGSNEDPLGLETRKGDSQWTITGQAPIVDRDTVYTFDVVVWDSQGNDTATVTITVKNKDGGEPYNPADNRDIPEVSARALVLTAEIAANMRAALGDEIPDEIRLVGESGISSATAADNDTVVAMRDAGYQLAANVSTITVSEDGYYAFTFTLPSGYVGMSMSDLSIFAKNIGVYASAAGLRADAVGDVSEGWLLDNTGKKADTATQDVIAVAHFDANSSSGTYFGSKVIPSTGLDELAISTVELTDTIRSNLARSLSADIAASVRSITDENILAPAEPSQKTIDEIKAEDNFELTYKLNSIQVDDYGYYAFNINIPSELINTNASDVKVYIIDQSALSGSSFRSSVITGVLSVFELDAFGLKLDSIGEKILAVGLLNAGTPLSVYLGKLIIMLLLGGCQVSFSGMGIIALAGAVLILGGAKLLKRR